jgi:hypothetical protein
VLCDISIKISQQGLQLYFRLHCNRRSAQKFMGSKVAGVPISRISRLRT